jgi:hypothetical protein
LAEALRERLAVIADHSHRDRNQSEHLQRLIDASSRIDRLIKSLPSAELDPQFRHYLDRRSYDKALAWIEGTQGVSE